MSCASAFRLHLRDLKLYIFYVGSLGIEPMTLCNALQIEQQENWNYSHSSVICDKRVAQPCTPLTPVLITYH